MADPKDRRSPVEADTVKCDGCGKDSGQLEKPWVWYERKDADGVQTACSRECIAVIAKATGKTRVILPW